jgi:hypothetical protein
MYATAAIASYSSVSQRNSDSAIALTPDRPLPEMVLLVTVMDPPLLYSLPTPPPSPVAELPEMVLLARETLPLP